jgi:hypothetical protein
MPRLRSIRIFRVRDFGVRDRKQLVAVLPATSLRKGLEEYAKRNFIEGASFAGNTMTGFHGSQTKKYEAQEAK